MIIQTTNGPMDESLLRKLDGSVDDENEYTTWVEYCLAECVGEAHRSGVPDSTSHFCKYHVHRSAYVRLKKGLVAFGESAKLG